MPDSASSNLMALYLLFLKCLGNRAAEENPSRGTDNERTQNGKAMLQKYVLEGDKADGNRDEEESEMPSQDRRPLLDPLQTDQSAREQRKENQHSDEVSWQAQRQPVRQQVTRAVN